MGSKSYVHVCECGKKWQVDRVKIIMRDSDSENCTCGREIVSWNGGHMFRVEEIKEGSDGPGQDKSKR